MYAGSFSKILAPSARLGFIMAPDEIMEKLVLAKQVSDSHTNFYWQVMLAEFMQNHQFEEHVSELKLYYKGKFEAMIVATLALPGEESVHQTDWRLFYIFYFHNQKHDIYELKYQEATTYCGSNRTVRYSIGNSRSSESSDGNEFNEM